MRWIAFLLLLLAGCASTRPVTVTAVRHTCGDSTTYSETHPIRVVPSGSTFTKYGMILANHTRPSLFLAPFEWPTQEQPEPLVPDLPVDTPIMVRNHESESWQRRHFAEWEDGKVTTFEDGGTSFTANSTVDWEQWRLPTEEELKGPTDAS